MTVAAANPARLSMPTFHDHGDAGDALCAIARVARFIDRGTPVPEQDDLYLVDAETVFDVPGCWAWASDAAMVRALERAVASGRRLQAIDRGRLRDIMDRAHVALERLDQQGAA